MRTTNIYGRGVIAALTLAVVCMIVPATRGDTVRSNRVEIRIHQRVHVNSRVVRIQHVADVLGGSLTTRERIKQLDLTELSTDKPFAVIEPRLVKIRCLVGGLKDPQFVVTGARSGLAELKSSDARRSVWNLETSSPDLEQLTLDAIRTELASVWQVPADEVFVRLERPLPSKRSIPSGVVGISVKAYLQARTKPGSVSAMTVISAPGQSPIESTVSVNAQHRPPEVKAGPASLMSPEKYAIDLASHSGFSRPGRIQSPPGIASMRTTRGPMDVRSRDRLKLIAKKGSLSVTILNAESLQSGRVGDFIRIRNPQSKKIVEARLVSPTTAILEL